MSEGIFQTEDFVCYDAATGERLKVTYTSSTSMRFSWDTGWEIKHDDGPWEPYVPDDDSQ